MEVKLMNGEKVFANWDYAKTKGLLLKKSTYSLTVTNHRVISTIKDKRNLSTEIINIEKISGVSTSYYKQRVGFFRIILTLGLALLFREKALTVSFFGVGKTYDMIGSQTVGGFFASKFGSKKKGNGSRTLQVDRVMAENIVETLPSLIYTLAQEKDKSAN